VEAAGVELSRARFSKLLKAWRFWSQVPDSERLPDRLVVRWRSAESSQIDPGCGDISNDVGSVKTHAYRSGRRSRLSQATSRRRRPCLERRARSGVHASTLEDGSQAQQRWCPPNISSVTADHDDLYELPHDGEAGSPFILPVTTTRSNSPRRHPRIRASPLRRLRGCTATEFFVVDLIAQKDPEADAQFARGRDAGLPESFLHEFPPIEAP